MRPFGPPRFGGGRPRTTSVAWRCRLRTPQIGGSRQHGSLSPPAGQAAVSFPRIKSLYRRPPAPARWRRTRLSCWRSPPAIREASCEGWSPARRRAFASRAAGSRQSSAWNRVRYNPCPAPHRLTRRTGSPGGWDHVAAAPAPLSPTINAAPVPVPPPATAARQNGARRDVPAPTFGRGDRPAFGIRTAVGRDDFRAGKTPRRPHPRRQRRPRAQGWKRRSIRAAIPLRSASADASFIGPMQMLLAIVFDKPIAALDNLHSAALKSIASGLVEDPRR